MAWTAITEADIRRKWAGAEWTAIKTAALGSGQNADTMLAEEIAAATRHIRARVGACAQNKLGPPGTIPDELEDVALVVLRYSLSTRLPGYKMTEERRKLYEDAVETLKDVAKCQFSIEPPEQESEEARPHQRPAITSPPLQFGAESTDGI
jgi:phage gp36-like protein